VLPAPAGPESEETQCSHIEKAAGDLKERAIWSTYWFPMADKNNGGDRSISQQLSSSWASFAKTGDPNVSGLATWPPYELKIDVMRKFGDSENGLVSGLKKDRVDYQIGTLKSLYHVD
jgi:para-nitrobenzyl esterase